MSGFKAHHEKKDVATNRPSYREARWERAVKVYTVNQESKYLLVQNVHALGVTDELVQLFALYGSVEEYRLLDEFPTEPYTDVYWIKFVDINSARVAKKKLDNHSFFGKNLHVCYGPEYETVQDTREKLQLRRRVIAIKTKGQTPTGSSTLTQFKVTQQSHHTVDDPQRGDSSHSISTNNAMALPPQVTLSQSGVEHSLSQHSNTLHLLPFPTLPRPPLQKHFDLLASKIPLFDTYPSMQPDYSNLSPVNQGKVRNVKKESVDVDSSKPLRKDELGCNKETIVSSLTPSTLDKNERISLYLSANADHLTSQPVSSLEKKQDSKVTIKSAMTNVLKGSSHHQQVLPQRLDCRNPGSVASGVQQQGSKTDEVTGFTVLTGDQSVDKSVTVIREQMTKVYMPLTVSDQNKKRKRKRI